MNEYSKEQLEDIAVVESLRSGIPTIRSTRNLPDLRPELISLVEKDLNLLKNKVPVKGRIIWGPYGDGKTHLLTSIEHKALDLNMAVSRISLSRHTNCKSFSKLYFFLASQVRTPHSDVMGIQRLLNQRNPSDLLQTPIVQPDRYSHPLFSTVLEDYFKIDGEDQGIVYNFLIGGKSSISELKKIHKKLHNKSMDKSQQGFNFKRDTISFFDFFSDILTFLGFGGWVILIDELELVSRLSKSARLDTYLNLNRLLNWSGELTCPIYIICAAAQSLQNDLWFFDHSKKTCDRALMSGLADERFGEEQKNKMRDYFEFALDEEMCPIIKPVKRENLLELLSKIKQIYESAFGRFFSFDIQKFVDSLPSETTIRTYVRALIEKLDIQKIYGTEAEIKTEAISGYSIKEESDYFFEEDN